MKGIVSDVGPNEWYMKMSASNNTSRDKISMAQHPSRESPMIFITRQGLWQEDEKFNRRKQRKLRRTKCP
jgi:hypothetical protein